MQTADGRQAQGAVKEEWQDFMRYFVVPLIEKKLQERVHKEDNMMELPLYRDQEGRDYTLSQIVSDVKQVFEDAYRGLQCGLWKCGDGVHADAYKCTLQTPFFITMDNGPIHSFNTDSRLIKDPGLCLLQCLWISPHGHDMHQTIEHCNSFIKRNVRKQLFRDADACAERGEQWTEMKGCASIARSCKQFAVEFKAHMVDNNLHRLFNALRQIATDAGELQELIERDGTVVKAYGTGGSYSYYN